MHFEYRITSHAESDFKRVIYFCSEKGDCRLEDVSDTQIKTLTAMLNDQGGEGWELVQLLFGKGGLLAVWKRALNL